MFCTFVALFWVTTTFIAATTMAKPLDNTEGKAELNENPDLEEIANREYDTAHGRILAVNQAHIRRQRAAQDNDTGNVFDNIEKANRANLSNLYQGDIIRDPFLEKDLKPASRNAQRARKRLWTSRVIPYYVPSRMSHIRTNLNKAIAEIERHTCLRLRPYNWRVHKNYIEFGDSDGCSSRVGKKYYEPGRQTISIGSGCNFPSTILHELMHAIGFFHEQARWDRDKFVKIYWENILEGFSDQFDKYGWRDIDDLGSSYDYKSVMHYSRKAFTKNGRPTIVAIGNENMEFGMPNRMLSPRDILEINALYDCRTTRFGWTQWSDWTPCDDDCYRTRERYCYHNGDIKSCKSAQISNVYGVDREKVKCPKSICPAPINGHWGRWSEWGACDANCNDGKRTRTRRCNNPPPGHGGRPCTGGSSDWTVCTKRRCRLDSDDTDFESGLGMWSQSTDDNLNWLRHIGPTPTAHTGPMKDHTTGTGYFMYVESSNVATGSNAKLVTSWINPTRDVRKCLKFYYMMYGKNMGEMWVQVELKGQYNSRYWIFHKKGDQGQDWKYGAGNINVDVGSSYRLTIGAKVGNGNSDIAIDDVYVDDGLCTCQDTYVSCSGRFKRENGCQTPWMRANCARTCQACKVDGSWGAWSGWTSCSVTCGTGARTRARRCDSPAPSNGGRACAGQPKETQRCSAAANCGTGTCQDSDAQCATWASSGECQKNPGWMLKNCRRSCHQCPTTAPCQDSDVQCASWASSGECQKNPGWMLQNCRKSCHQCPTTAPPCVDGDSSCAAWAKTGWCQKNPGWMLTNCKKSCNQC